jgi:GNAT superfamily N-acetyltransferase
MAVDLIYNMQRTQQYDLDDGAFFFVDSLNSALSVLPIMWRDRGMLGTAKLLAKILLHRCFYFGLALERQPLSTGVLALGYCRFYQVPSDSIVIGEMVTAPASRGKGHATRAIMLAISTMIRKGSTNFYIDTQQQNTPMIRSIAKLGFGRPIGGDGAGEHL